MGDQLWTRGIKYSTKQGEKICFTCKGFPRCAKRMQMFLDPESQDVNIYVSADEHNHSAIISGVKLDPRSRAKVLELLDVGVTKPRRILKELSKCNLPMLTKPQINNLKRRVQLKASGPLTCSLNDFLLWVEKRNKVPTDEDEVYVVRFDYKLSKKNKTKIKDLRCFLTTKRLIRQALM